MATSVKKTQTERKREREREKRGLSIAERERERGRERGKKHECTGTPFQGTGRLRTAGRSFSSVTRDV